MITMELAGVEIDHCLECGGIWLDRGELEIFIGNQLKADGLISSLRPAPRPKERYRRCPLCDAKMEKVAMTLGAAQVILDRCRKDHGLWFDKGELVQVLRGSGVEHNQLMHLFAQMFGLERNGT